jgi:hypothetical protein
LTLYISDQADEFRIEISGRFADSAVSDAATAWRAALLTNTPRRVSVDITRMTGYDRAGYLILREFHKHGTHIVAGTPRSLLFFTQISSSQRSFHERGLHNLTESAAQPSKRPSSQDLTLVPARAVASGE